MEEQEITLYNNSKMFAYSSDMLNEYLVNLACKNPCLTSIYSKFSVTKRQ